MKHFNIAQILTETEIDKAWQLYQSVPESLFAEAVDNQLIKPNMERINKALGQENDSRYLAYAVEFAFVTTANRHKDSNGQ
jgi:hypothetical protein